MILNCLIVDDEPMARKVLEEYIEDTPFLTLTGQAENPMKASALMQEVPVDLLFLDINMPKLNGLEFLRSQPSLPPAILTTAYAAYAIEGFELSVLDYLVKPFSFERFLRAAHKARDFIHKPAEDAYFFVKWEGKIEKVGYDEVLYIEAMQNYVVIHTETRKMMVYLTMKGLLEQLPSDRFIKVHKSYIVHLPKIKSIDNTDIRIGTTTIPISQNLFEEVMRVIVGNKLIRR
jgi:DNA-binding LytR/AlgR family response regulator